jgi:hypothetical protein
MCGYNKSLLKQFLLILMLFVGPLHAQIIFACAKIEKTAGSVMHITSDMAKHNTNLCNDYKECVNLDCENTLNSNEGPCCDGAAALSISPDLQQNIPAIKFVGVESDVDPPQVIFTTLGFFFPSQTIAMSIVPQRISSDQSSSNTYLITKRLRI